MGTNHGCLADNGTTHERDGGGDRQQEDLGLAISVVGRKSK